MWFMVVVLIVRLVTAEDCTVLAPDHQWCTVCNLSSYDQQEINYTITVSHAYLGRITNTTTDLNCTKFLFCPRNIGIGTIWFRTGDNNISESVNLIVKWKGDISQIIFQYVTICCVTVFIFCIGCELEFDQVWSYVKRPILPMIGLSCQYLIMPSVAMMIYSVSPLTIELGLGLFTLAASPGGFGSNMWCILLGGDLNLSSAMTFFSTAISPVMMLMWLTVFQKLFVATSIHIPYLMILFQLLQIVIPLILGMTIVKYFTKVKGPFVACGRIVIGIFLVNILTLGIYTNLHIYRLLQIYPHGILVGALLSWIAFVISYIFSRFVVRLGHKLALTIALETGIQNIGIALLILKYTMPQPQGDIGSMIPIMSGFTVLIPLWLYWCIIFAYKKCKVEEQEPFEPSIDWQEKYINPSFEDHPVKAGHQRNVLPNI